MNINKRAKINVYYLILIWATNEALKQDVFFIDRSIMLKIATKNRLLLFKKQKESKKIKSQTMKLLAKVQQLSVSMEKLAFEMLVYITLNWLMNESEEKNMIFYKDIPICNIFDEIRDKFKKQLNEHCDFIEQIEKEL